MDAPGTLLRSKQLEDLDSKCAALQVAVEGLGGEMAKQSAAVGGMQSNCVQLLHVPTGIAVRCHKTRSRDLNRKEARRLLQAELDDRLNGAASRRALRGSGSTCEALRNRRDTAILASRPLPAPPGPGSARGSPRSS